MNPNIPQAKTELRRQIRLVLAGITDRQRIAASKQVVLLLSHQESWRRARSILFYAPIKNELDVWPLVVSALEAGKLVSLPRFNVSTQSYVACRVREELADIAPGLYGIPEPRAHCEPVALNQLDFALVPGVAFDLHGRRLGHGRGYYDRLLAQMRGKTCGVAYDEQVVDNVPVQPHDADVNCIVTPTRWIEF